MISPASPNHAGDEGPASTSVDVNGGAASIPAEGPSPVPSLALDDFRPLLPASLHYEADGVTLWHGDALRVSEFIAPESVDLIVTSPPYFALRSYTDGGEHYEGQIGSESTPGEFVDALVACTREWVKVLKPSGSIFVNLGDKYAGSGGHNNNGLGGSTLSGGKRKLDESLGEQFKTSRRQAPDRYNQSSDGVRAKSLMGLPWRYALRCIDELGLILRRDLIWSKPNGMPESVTDRCRSSHEYWFHFTREGDYFANMDPIREPHLPASISRAKAGFKTNARIAAGATSGALRTEDVKDGYDTNPLGRGPGSVWSVATEPLIVPDSLEVDHFAAFPSEWPRRLILGWSPEGGTVLDPFGGTGTTALVARALGRQAHHVDLSCDYLRLAQWRIWEDDRTFRKASERSGIPVPKAPAIDGQAELFGDVA